SRTTENTERSFWKARCARCPRWFNDGNVQEIALRNRVVGLSVVAVTVSVMALAAQQRPAPGPETSTGVNSPAAPTSPAGSGGLTTGRGRGPAAPQGPTPHLPDGT